MSGPISVTTIRAGDKRPPRQKRTLTLKFRLEDSEGFDCETLATMLQHYMRDWQDGRRPFDAELVESGLSRCLKRAVSDTFEEEAQKEFGHEMVQVRPDSKVARWYLEARKRYEQCRKPWIQAEPTVEIT